MSYLPLFVDSRNKRILIIGGGSIALRKAKLLREFDADICVISDHFLPEFQSLAVNCIRKRFEPADIAGFGIVIGATSDEQLHNTLYELTRDTDVLLNCVDNPSLCDFIFPSIVKRDDLVAAISSGGKSPVLARYLRTKIEAILTPDLGRLNTYFGNIRQRLKQLLPEPNQRRVVVEKLLESNKFIEAPSDALRDEILEGTLAQSTAKKQSGEVYLIGAGPGDPELMTLKAIRLLQRADIIIYDRLVSPEIRAMGRRDAIYIDAGKRASEHTLSQDQINNQLVEHALAGHCVARLKGGDPYLFGRGAEEIQTLVDFGINFSVVPGITAASGCASYAGIPLTHRDHAQSVRFITGHLKDGTIDLNWASLRDPSQTLVFYMGLGTLSMITQKLMANGRLPTTPIALIEKGTTENQRVLIGSLQNIFSQSRDYDLKSPTLIIVGDVIKVQKQLDWRGDTIYLSEECYEI